MHLLINADDFGRSDFVNRGIDYCFNSNLIHRTTLMVNMQGVDEAVDLSKKHGYSNRVGLHINLEEGHPLTKPILNTIFCTNGKFNGQALRNQKNRFILDKRVQMAVEHELRAQIERYLGFGFTLLHIDSHRHAHTNPSIFRLLMPLMKEYGFRSCRLSRNIPPKEIRGAKKVYKTVFNNEIKAFNQRNNDLQWYVAYFGSQWDIDKISTDERFQNSYIEVETHPIIKESNLLEDLLYPIGVDSWIKHLSNH